MTSAEKKKLNLGFPVEWGWWTDWLTRIPCSRIYTITSNYICDILSEQADFAFFVDLPGNRLQMSLLILSEFKLIN